MSRRHAVLLVGLAAVWGGSYALIRVALDDGVPWAWVGFVRIGLGALAMTAIAVRLVGWRALLARPRDTALVGAAQIGVPFLLIPWGERHVPSGLVGVLIATAPLFTVLIAGRFAPDTALGRGGVAGVAVGFVGIVLLFAADLSASGEAVVGGLAVVLAALGYGIGSTLSRLRLQGMEPVAVATATLWWASGVSLLVAVFVPGGSTLGHLSAGTVLGLAVLGVVGTGIAYLVFFTLVREVGPPRAMLVTYLAPVFALGYGAAFLGEAVTAAAVAGVVLIVGGSLLGTGAAARLSPRWAPRRSARRRSRRRARGPGRRTPGA